MSTRRFRLLFRGPSRGGVIWSILSSNFRNFARSPLSLAARLLLDPLILGSWSSLHVHDSAVGSKRCRVIDCPDPLLLHVLTRWAPSLLFFWCSTVESFLLALSRPSCSWTVHNGRFRAPLIGSLHTSSLPCSLPPSRGRSAPLLQPKRIWCRK